MNNSNTMFVVVVICSVQGYKCMYDLQVMHRDIKPQNLLIGSDGTLKIADFGFAKDFSIQDMTATVCGSPLYMVCFFVWHVGYNVLCAHMRF